MRTDVHQNSAIELFDYAIVRCASWPIETLEPFSSPRLAALAAEVDVLRTLIERQRCGLCDALHAEIPRVESRLGRRVLLAARRRLHNSTLPGGNAGSDATRILPPQLRGEIEEDERERTRLRDLEQELAQLHADELQRERNALRQATATPEFARALAVANPDLAVRWDEALRSEAATQDPVRGPNSRQARMEATIFFYLCRAAARPTPGGLWAGVAQLRSEGEEDAVSRSPLTVVPANRRVQVTVNLEPFKCVVEHLRRRPHYRSRVRLTYSAYRDRDTWVFQSPAEGRHEWRGIVPDEDAAALLEILADGRRRNLEDVVEHCASMADTGRAGDYSSRSRLRRAADRLIECGLLTSSIIFPPSAPDCWTALDEAAVQLDDIDSAEWVGRVTRIREICDALSGQIDAMVPGDIHDHRRSVEQELLSLYSWAGVDQPLPQPALLIDVRHGFDVLATRTMWTSVHAATIEILSFYQSHGAAESLRRATLDALLGDGVGCERPFLETVRRHSRALDLSIAGVEPAATRLAERLEREVVARQHMWYERLLPHARDVSPVVAPMSTCTSEPLAGFDGTLVFSVAADGRLRGEWGRPHALCLISRFVPLLERGSERPALTSEIERWYVSWNDSGFAPAEVTGTDLMNPNAGTRPNVGARQVGMGGESFGNLVVGATARGARPWLRIGVDRKRFVPVYNCTARVGMRDACSDALYRLALGHGWEFTCRRLFPRDEVRAHLPRLVLPGGVTLSPARWFLTREQVEALVGLDGVHQYIAWVGHVRRLGLPERVRVATEAGPEAPLLYMPVTSPLAVASLLAKVAARPRSLEFIEDHAGPGEWSIVDERGGHYASEIVVCWRDASYWHRAFGDERIEEIR